MTTAQIKTIRASAMALVDDIAAAGNPASCEAARVATEHMLIDLAFDEAGAMFGIAPIRPVETCGKVATAPFRAPFNCGLPAGHDGDHHG